MISVEAEDSEEIAEIRPQVKQELMLASPADFTLGGGSAGSGKHGLLSGHTWLMRNVEGYCSMSQYPLFKHLIPREVSDMDFKILYKNGKFVSIAEAKVGDEICNPDGSFQRIVDVHKEELRAMYRVTFEDGTFSDCSDTHLWASWEARSMKNPKLNKGFTHPVLDSMDSHSWNINYITKALLYTTEQLHRMLANGKRMIIPISAPLRYQTPPNSWDYLAYTLGFWIGDGHTDSGKYCITTSDDEVLERLQETVKLTSSVECLNRITPVHRVRLHDDKFSDLMWRTKLSGVLQHERFIPEGFMRASLSVRLELARGLFDADGYASGGDKNEVSYCTTSPRLAEDVANLVRSLGYMAKVREKQGISYNNGEAKQCRMSYIVGVEGNDRWRLFHLKRKIENALSVESNIWVGKAIISVEPIGEHYCRCISVNSTNRLYITDGYNVTHNTWTILMHPLRYLLTLRNFRGVIFRRTTPQIRAPGGIWDAAVELYSQFPELVLRSTSLTVTNPEMNSSIAFSHLEQAKDVLNWQGTELAFIGFDELTHFEASQLWYMMSRNRSMCGLRPYIFGTCNPESNHWLLDFVDWYLYPLGHPLAGTPDPEKSGKLRYFIRLAGDLHWSDNIHELVQRTGCDIDDVKTFTFIPSSIYDNGKLLEKDKGYLSNLKALPYVDRMRLLEANWYVKLSAGMFFKDEWFPRIAKTAVPRGCLFVRYWDRAGTEPSTTNPNPDWTAGVRIGRHAGTGEFFVTDVARVRVSPAKVVDMIIATALADGFGVPIALEQDPGQAGKSEAATIADTLINLGFTVHVVVASKDKATRAKPASVEAENGRIKVVSAAWTNAYLEELENFDGTGKGSKDDQVDGTSGGVNLLMTLVPVAVFHAAFGGARNYPKQLGNTHG